MKLDESIRRSTNGFCDLGINRRLITLIDKLNFENPTPIQEESIPAGIRGDDIIANARTGSGKTLAFGIPMIQRLLENKKGKGLIIVPTRELAIQVAKSLQPIIRSLNIRTVVLIGGVSISLQRNTLEKNPRIIIATPGRLKDHIQRKTVNLSNIDVFVLDEADRMLDMGFIPDIKKIMESLPENRQTLLFSATIPKDVEAIAEEFMKFPTRIAVDSSGTVPTEVSQEMFIIRDQDKTPLLVAHLKLFSGPVLVFTRTRRKAHKLTAKVSGFGFTAAEIHSNRSLAQRHTALEGFKRGKYQVLIATDIAARGIDVAGIALVVNYDMPANSEDYIHRIGRTGRAGKVGCAISYVTNGEKRSVINLERFLNTKLIISTPPALASEKLFIEKTDQMNSRSKPSNDEKLSKPNSSNSSSSRHRGYSKFNSNNNSSNGNKSRPKRFKKTNSKRKKSKCNA